MEYTFQNNAKINFESEETQSPTRGDIQEEFIKNGIVSQMYVEDNIVKSKVLCKIKDGKIFYHLL